MLVRIALIRYHFIEDLHVVKSVGFEDKAAILGFRKQAHLFFCN